MRSLRILIGENQGTTLRLIQQHRYPYDERFPQSVNIWICQAIPALCGINHFIVSGFPGPDDYRLNLTFTGLGPDTDTQLTLNADSSELVLAQMDLAMPDHAGAILDVANAGDPDHNYGLRIDFGFDPRTTWRAFSGELTGGVVTLGTAPRSPVGAAPGTCRSDR